MILSINQPAYLPWLGYMDRIDASDLHVVLDHVQFEKNSFVNRNRIRTPTGVTWLTIPLQTSGRFGDLPLNDLPVADFRWRRKHAAALRSCYGRCAGFKEISPLLAEIYDGQGDAEAAELFLPRVDTLTGVLLGLLGIDTPRVLSSSLSITSKKSQLVLDICRHFSADVYLSGPLGRDYLDLAAFAESGIEVRFHDYAPVEYRQAWPGFHSHLAAIDAMFTHGTAGAREIMMAGRRLTNSY